MMKYLINRNTVDDTQSNDKLLTRVGAWASRLINWGGKGANDLLSLDTYVYSGPISCVKERGYEERLVNFLDAYYAGEVDLWNLSLFLTCFDG